MDTLFNISITSDDRTMFQLPDTLHVTNESLVCIRLIHSVIFFSALFSTASTESGVDTKSINSVYM